MINLSNYKVYYDPFPHLIFSDVFGEDLYSTICKEFPEIDKLKLMKDKIQNENKQIKYNLSDRHPSNKEFVNFIKKCSYLKILYNYLVSEKFNEEINNVLLKNYIDIGINKLNKGKSIKALILKFLFNIKTSTSIEFSAINCNSGFLKPHTDGSNKIFSFVIPIIDNDKIMNYKNLGTSIRTAIDDRHKYNFQNKTVPFELTKEIKEIPFKKNQLFLFIKTHNSLHSVGPIISGKTENENLFRKSITGFLEKAYNF